MWQINEVVLFDNDPYRILAIEDGQVVWMQISADKGVPQARAELLLMQYLDEGRLVRTDDPYVHLDLEEPSVDSVSFQKREEDYRKILPIINSKDRFDPKVRSELVEHVVQEHKVTKATVYKLLRRYWQRGQTPNALIP
ncbi:MAG: transposase, partial [Escherichia coli]|nr:transposase [Escherichia coli]